MKLSKTSAAEFVKGWASDVQKNNLSEEERSYLRHSWKRYIFVIDLLDKLVPTLQNTRSERLRLLDVGPHFFTSMVHDRFADLTINTLGFTNQLCPESIITDHYSFDLNDAQFKDKWPKFQTHDLIIAGEVIEHLYTAPTLVFGFLGSLLATGGKLVVTTPNAVAITRRIILALGRNPYEMIRESRNDPGHIREYTRGELEDIGTQAGLLVSSVDLVNYFISDNRIVTLINKLSNFVPSFRDGITIVYEKASKPVNVKQ